MKIFVTGACGFIGSHLVEALRDAGHDVTGMALYRADGGRGWLDRIGGVTKVRGDVRDVEQVCRLVNGHEMVFHLAAQIEVPYSYVAPRSFVETNVLGTLNILEAVRQWGIKLVHTSSSEVYGTAVRSPQNEEHPLQAQSPYAASKIAADKLVESYVATYGVEAVILRPFNTYGPRQSDRAVIPTIIRQHFSGEGITVGDIDSERDFTYIDDMVRAFLAVMDLEEGVYNAGYGESIAIEDLLRMITEKSVVVGMLRPPNSEVRHLCADYWKLRNAADWIPTIPLDLGLHKTMEWHREHHDSLRY